MKSKIVFITILISMLFTISHDFFISNQIEEVLAPSSCKLSKDKSITIEEHNANQMCDFHMIFHFHALFPKKFTFELFELKESITHYLKHIFFTSIIGTAFKPPRS